MGDVGVAKRAMVATVETVRSTESVGAMLERVRSDSDLDADSDVAAPPMPLSLTLAGKMLKPPLAFYALVLLSLLAGMHMTLLAYLPDPPSEDELKAAGEWDAVRQQSIYDHPMQTFRNALVGVTEILVAPVILAAVRKVTADGGHLDYLRHEEKGGERTPVKVVQAAIVSLRRLDCYVRVLQGVMFVVGTWKFFRSGIFALAFGTALGYTGAFLCAGHSVYSIDPSCAETRCIGHVRCRRGVS